MIFAELEYEGHYDDVHERLVALLGSAFPVLRSGHQGDSWIWVFDGEMKVAVDTFTSMRHQVKAGSPGPHVQRVIEVLRRHFVVTEKAPPEAEGHEDV